MERILSAWSALDVRRQIIVGAASLAMFAAILGLSRIATSPGMTLLYSGLESSAAGEVVRALEQRGIAHQIRGDAIYVPGVQRDALRMTLASEGLPTAGSKGYEILDGLSGFGTTSQMFDAAYWRAKEGELSRTIVASPHVRTARVHISNSQASAFQRTAEITASVTIGASGGALSATHAKALKYLVASAVSGLTPENVAVIDSEGGLVAAAEDTATPAGEDRADILRKRIERLLEARVGFGNAVVEVSVDTVTERESIVQRTLDPDSRVVISTDTEERSLSANDSGGGVTVASNLPDGAAGGDGSSKSENAETRERINYEVGETQREIIKAPGAIKRLTVAVLVNGTTAVGDDGASSFQPRSESELTDLKDLVASAVGFDERRGDVITLKTLEFEPIAPLGTEAEPTSLMDRLNIMKLAQMGVLAVVALIMSLFVIRPILLSKPQPAPVAAIPSPDHSAALTPPADVAGQVLPAMEQQAGTEQSENPSAIGTVLPVPAGLPGPGEDPNAEPERVAPSSEDAAARLRDLISERQDETLEILRGWMSQDSKENA